MKTNSITYFNGKQVVTSKDGKIDQLDGSNLTGIELLQLDGAPNEMLANGFLKINNLGTGFEFINLESNSKVFQFGISNEAGVCTWGENNLVTITHNLGGYVFFNVYNSDGIGIPVVPLFVDANNIAFYVEESDLPTDINKHVVVCTKGGVVYNFDSYTKPVIANTISDATYGIVGALDATYGISLLGYQEVKRIQLKVITANSNITGNVVINAFGTSFTIPVTNQLAWVNLIPSTTYQGLVTLTRDYTNVLDTLKENSVPITCKVVDWRLY